MIPVASVPSLTLFLAGGYLTQAKGWRWTFWVLAMAVRVDSHIDNVRLLTE
jgi:predicted MFS family arabinose efflux permease